MRKKTKRALAAAEAANRVNDNGVAVVAEPAPVAFPDLPRLVEDDEQAQSRTEDDDVHDDAQAKAVGLIASRCPLTDADEKYAHSKEAALTSDALAEVFGVSVDGTVVGFNSLSLSGLTADEWVTAERVAEEALSRESRLETVGSLTWADLHLPTAPASLLYDDLTAEFGFSPVAYMEDVARRAAEVDMSESLSLATGESAPTRTEPVAEEVEPVAVEPVVVEPVVVEPVVVEPVVVVTVDEVEPVVVEEFVYITAYEDVVPLTDIHVDEVAVTETDAATAPSLVLDDTAPLTPVFPGYKVAGHETYQEPVADVGNADSDESTVASDVVAPVGHHDDEEEDEPVWVETIVAPPTLAEQEAYDALVKDLREFSDIPSGPVPLPVEDEQQG